MAINYIDRHAAEIDEVFSRASITDDVINNDYSFVGAQTVKVHRLDTVAMTDYTRSGTARYGTPSELQDEIEELTMQRDRAFTFTVDKMNSEEDQALNSGKALARQIREVIVPEIDEYRMNRMASKVGNATYGDYSTTKHYERFIDLNALLDDDKVPTAGRIAYVSNAFYKGLKLDTSFIDYAKMDQQQLEKGQIGECDGVVVRKGSGRLPVGVDCMIVHKSACCSPKKLAEYKEHLDPPGVSGVLVEGRVYYDAFVTERKKVAIGVHRSALVTLTVVNAAGASGKTKFTSVTGYGEDAGCPTGTLCYLIAASPTAPALGADISDAATYPVLTLNTDIAATSGDKYIILLKDALGKCIGTSGTAATATLGS